MIQYHNGSQFSLIIYSFIAHFLTNIVNLCFYCVALEFMLSRAVEYHAQIVELVPFP